MSTGSSATTPSCLEPSPSRETIRPASGPGNFLAFDVDDAEELHQAILGAGIYIDRRGRRLRFGFGVYQDEAMVDALLVQVQRILR